MTYTISDLSPSECSLRGQSFGDYAAGVSILRSANHRPLHRKLDPHEPTLDPHQEAINRHLDRSPVIKPRNYTEGDKRYLREYALPVTRTGFVHHFV